MYVICHIYVGTSILFYLSYKYLYLMKRKEKALPYAAEEFYVHGPVHRESVSIIVQQDVIIHSFYCISADSSTCFR